MEIQTDMIYKEQPDSAFLFQASPRPDPYHEAKQNYELGVIAAMEIAANIDLEQGIEVSAAEQGIEVSAAEVRDWVSGHRNVDIHQRLVDKTSGQSRLKDSGAQISAAAKKPGDKIDNSVN